MERGEEKGVKMRRMEHHHHHTDHLCVQGDCF